MAFVEMKISIFFLFLSLFSSSVYGATYYNSSGQPVPWAMDLSGAGDHYYHPPRGAGWERVTTPDQSYQKSLPYDVRTKSGQMVRVPAPAKIPIDVPKFGKAVAKFAKAIPPVAAAAAMVDLICDLSEICPNFDKSGWQKSTPGTWPQSQSCSAASGGGPECGQQIVLDNPQWVWWRSGQGYVIPQGCALRMTASWTYSAGGYDCSLATQPPRITAPVTAADWDSAESKLNNPSFWPYLDAAGQPVPMKPLVVSPVNFDAGTEITTRRDSTGTVVGTDEISRQISLTPSPTLAQPDRVTVIEKETTIIKDTNNTVQKTTETSTTPLPAEPPAEVPDPCLENPDRIGCMNAGSHDELVKKKEFTFEYAAENAAFSGSCPPPIVVLGHSLSFQPACDAMVMIRGIVLGMAAVASAFILIGAFTG